MTTPQNFTFSASLKDENQDHYFLELQNGKQRSHAYLPKNLIPFQQLGDTFVLSLQSEKTAKLKEERIIINAINELLK